MQYIIAAAVFGFFTLFFLISLPVIKRMDEEQFYKAKTGEAFAAEWGSRIKTGAVGVVNSLFGQEYEKRLKLLLLRSSREAASTDMLIMYSVASMVICLIVGILACYDLGIIGIAAGITAGISGFRLPEMILSSRVEKRQKQIQRSLLQVVEALGIAVNASKELQSAIMEVAGIIPGPLTDEFRRTVGELRKKSRKEAFHDMGERIGLDDVRVLLEAILQAFDTGTPMAAILHNQAKRLRLAMRTELNEKAGKASFRIIFPMLVFQVPACLAIMMIPAIRGILEIFATTG